ncbi:MAG: FadR family transcriptional regulator [Actinomycetota bacterium]|nr:FadR family transcriptional regulator [Actinomycetota bacterium]
MTERTSLIEGAVGALRARITSGEWAVGTRIPPEPALTELLGVGRNTVREAVQSLVHSGLLVRRQGSGTYVLADDELAVSIGRHIAGASRRDVLQVRRALEVEAARLAAKRHTRDDDVRLERLLRARTEAWHAGEVDAMVDSDLALHREIARVSRNPVLESMYENLLEAIVENIRTNLDGDGHFDHDHDGLVEAIVASDPKRAGSEVVRYLATLLREDPEET